ncbi:MAG TPA: hypothetical protein VD994_06855, partial [Prosthecobacter sp.]|nr:hypothetical protein [Prosthecobacter sp.]
MAAVANVAGQCFGRFILGLDRDVDVFGNLLPLPLRPIARPPTIAKMAWPTPLIAVPPGTALTSAGSVATRRPAFATPASAAKTAATVTAWGTAAA